jgi:hypothetical protein
MVVVMLVVTGGMVVRWVTWVGITLVRTENVVAMAVT